MTIPDQSTSEPHASAGATRPVSTIVRSPARLRLYLDSVRYSYPTRPDFLGPVTLTIGPGECWGIIGPNGAGKSTLLRLMAGLRQPDSGCVTLGDRSLAQLTGRDRAQRIAFVPQHPPADIDSTVRDVVMLGRFPHRTLSLFESTDDRRIVDRAMEITETIRFADRPMTTLSGGEAQRVHIAAALAQEPQVLLLDEPTASLDLQHQQAIFHILRKRTTGDRLAVAVVTHDVNLARQYCSHVLLLHNGRLVADGEPEDVVTPEVLRPVYGVELATLTIPGDATRSWVVPTGNALREST